VDSFTITTAEADDRAAEIERARAAIFRAPIRGLTREAEDLFLAFFVEIRRICARDEIPASFAWGYVESFWGRILDALPLDTWDQITLDLIVGRIRIYLGVDDDGIK
jgi:hypothetical protein